MIYEIRHRTTYAYEAKVTFARCVLRLTPPSNAAQTVYRSEVRVSPTPARSTTRVGPFDEQTITVLIDAPHDKLVIEARSRVDVHPSRDTLPFGMAWEAVRARAMAGVSLASDAPAAFLYPTRRTPITPVITDYARDSFTPGREIVEAATDLMTRINHEFIYDGDATTVSTPPAEAFSKRRGVCQDFAHVMICALKGLGLPAAYVSGYLRTRPPPGRPRLEGADATHAWVSLWCGEDIGWVGFDPTNAIIAAESHIVLAVGRDYADVAPIDGILLSPGDQDLKVEVTVAPEGE